MNDLNELKSFLRDYVEAITWRSKGKQWVCPLCGSGTGKNGTGAFSIDKDGTHWKCFACGRGGDIFDLCKEHEHVDAAEAARIITARYGQGGVMTVKKTAQTSSGSNQPHDKAAAGTDPEPKRDIAGEIKRYAAALENSPGQEYLEGRGITLETMKRFNLGYNAAQRTITIPYNRQGTYYDQRSIEGKRHYNLAGVQMPIFNAEALEEETGIIYVVESPLCAISIMQAGGVAVALSGTSGINRLCAKLKRNPTKAALIICLDNDDPGRQATADLGQALEDMGYQYITDGTAAIMGDITNPMQDGYRKDPNEVLQKDGAEALKIAVCNAAEDFRQAIAEAEEERAAQRGAEMVNSFLQDVTTRRYAPMPTGIHGIDSALQGGFMRQQLIVLGAAPGAGKTSLAQWIFENMAKNGTTSTIYLNLEMSREQLLARSISRIATQQGTKLNPLDVMRGYLWDADMEKAIFKAAETYANEIAPRFTMNPDSVKSPDLDMILAYMNQEAARAEKTQQRAPAVVIDYLQLITGREREDAATTIKRAVLAFKQYAIDHNTLVFCIIAHNRSSNSSGSVSMEAARDTSAIEYSADIQLALTFKACIDPDGVEEDEEESDGRSKRRKPKKPSQLTKAERKDLVLRVVKGRFGGAGTDVDLHFDGDTMTFKQAPAVNFKRTQRPAYQFAIEI